MVALSLKICVRQCNVVKTMQFEPFTPVYDACRIIRERVPEAQTGQGWIITGESDLHNGNMEASTFASSISLCVSASDYGLFLSDDDPRKGIWLESGRTLDYYMLRNGVRLNLIVQGGNLPVSLIITRSGLYFLVGAEIFLLPLLTVAVYSWEGLWRCHPASPPLFSGYLGV